MIPRAILLAGILAAPSIALAQPRVDIFGGLSLLDATVGRNVDQGGDGLRLGARVGYDWIIPGGPFAGVEAQASVSNLCSRMPGWHTCERWQAGAFGRVGYATPGGALIYGRVGAVTARFTGTPGSRTAIAPAVGVGAEIPFAGRAFARIDGTYARLPVSPSVEVTTVTVGIGWRF